MNTKEVLEKVSKLPANLLQSASDYIDFLLEKAREDAALEFNNKPKRVLGIGKGKGWMADDFIKP